MANILDTFTRTASNGWGTAESGQTWSIPTTGGGSAAASRYSIDGARAAMATPGNASSVMTVPDTFRQVEMYATVQILKPATGNAAIRMTNRGEHGSTTTIAFRATGTAASNTIVCQFSIADASFIGGSASIVWDPAASYRVRTQVIDDGNGGTLCRAKMWPTTAAEPTAWLISAVSSTAVTAAGPISLYHRPPNAAATVYWDDVSIAEYAPPVTVRADFAGVYFVAPTSLGVGAQTFNVSSLQAKINNVVVGTVTPTNNWGHIRIPGLTPDTEYTIQLVDAATSTVLTTVTGRTLATATRNFTYVSASCHRNNGSAPIFDDMAALNPDLFVHQGDMHYQDAQTEANWRTGMTTAMSQSTMVNLMKDTPMVWVPDNHDWGGNTSWRDSPASGWVPSRSRDLFGPQTAATAQYRSWSHGGIKFIQTDMWSVRDQAVTDPSTDGQQLKSMLGAEQRSWLFRELITASEPIIVWFCSFPLYKNPPVGNGRWNNFQWEARQIQDFLYSNPTTKNKIVCVGGDSHNVLADDGQNTLFGVPSLNASPIDRAGDPQATEADLAWQGTWNIAKLVANPSTGYFSRLDFTWFGSSVQLRWRAMERGNATPVAEFIQFYSPDPAGDQKFDALRAGDSLADRMYMGDVLLWSR